jgi:hypothetical protein
VVSFLESAGVALVAALIAACWHSLSRNEKPDARELAIGFDLLVSAMVLQFGFLPGSRGSAVGFRWASLVLLFLMITAMAQITRMRGYEKSEDLFRRDDSGSRRIYRPTDQMTEKAAWYTSIFGSAILCVFWWLNMNIGLVIAVWKGVPH